VLCEQVVQGIYGERALIIRPGLIVGPHDPSNRFTYWVTRVAEGGKVLAPDDRDAPVQLIDVRDLAEWTLRMIDANASGIYNATGPAEPLTLGATLQACKDATQVGAEFVWVAPQLLLEQGVAPWTEIPLWVAGDNALNQVSIARALAEGLTFRPLAATIAATLSWARTQDAADPPRAGLTREREAELIRLYHTSSAS
jgi:2'-hydroxyisoflavone reductase